MKLSTAFAMRGVGRGPEGDDSALDMNLIFIVALKDDGAIAALNFPHRELLPRKRSVALRRRQLGRRYSSNCGDSLCRVATQKFRNVEVIGRGRPGRCWQHRGRVMLG